MFFGSIVALVTPYFDDGGIDFATLAELVEVQVASGSDAIVVCGSTGEGWALSSEEKSLVLQTTLDVVGKQIPVIMNTGSCATQETVELTRSAKEAGADGALVIVPYYNQPTFSGCKAHFAAVADEGLPVMLYHHPGRTNIKLTLEQLLELGAYVCSYKDASGDMTLLRALIQSTEHPVFAGDDGVAKQTLAWGGKGVVSVVANAFPKEWRDFIHGESENVLEGVVNALSKELNPQGIKALMGILGKCRSDVRLPLVPARPEVVQNLAQSVHALQKEAELRY